MKNSFLISLLFSGIATFNFAQTKNLTMENAISGSRTLLAPQKLNSLQWIKSMDAFCFIDSVQTLQMRSVTTKEFLPSIPLVLLNAKLKLLHLDTLAKFPVINWENNTIFNFNFSKKLMEYDRLKNNLVVKAQRNYADGAENQDEEPNTKAVAYTVENNLYILKEDKIIILSDEKEKNIITGQKVHREEFGITKGTFWSPKGNYLAFYRMDQTMVSDYPLVDITKKPAQVKLIKYPMAGEKSHVVTVGIYDIKTAKITFLKTGLPAEQYLTNLSWSPDEKKVFIAVVNRGQDTMKLNSYSAQTGDFEKTLFEETDSKYVHPETAMEFVKNNPGQFIWQSWRDGFQHLYLYDSNGKLIRQLTKGNWEVTKFNGVDAAGTRAFFTCTATSPLNRDLYSVELATGTLLRITKGDGTHTASVSESGNYALDNFSSTTIPRIIAIYPTSGKSANILLNAPNPLADYNTSPIKIFTIKSTDGSDLYCRQYFPIPFDSTKKYPVIYYLYGGPNVQLITNSWQTSTDLWFQYMAERGFIVFTLDNRGTANRGKTFEQTIFRNLGNAELDDHLQGVSYLKSLKYVDSTRMGLDGWSYGGFLTTSMMTRHPGLFKVAVAGGPVIDWSYYEIMYTERYMDTPQTNSEGYSTANVLRYADQLKGKLLIIHGTSDPVVLWQHSQMFIKKCIDNNLPVDYFVYPGHEHNVSGKDRIHLMNKIADYFQSNL